MTEATENLEKRFEEFLAAGRKRDEALEKRIAALEAQINQQNDKEKTEESSKYPKRIMRLSELVKLGYTKEYLMKQYRIRGQKFARKNRKGVYSWLHVQEDSVKGIRRELDECTRAGREVEGRWGR